MKNNGTIRICITVLVILVFLIGSILIFKTKNGSNEDFTELLVKVDAVTTEGTPLSYYIQVESDGKNAKAINSGLDKTLYIVKDKIFFEEGGMFKYLETSKSYENVMTKISNFSMNKPISEEGKKKYYNFELSSKEINEILDHLFLGIETDRSENALAVKNDGRLESFTIYLIGIDGYQGINISISSKKERVPKKVDVPKLYDSLLVKIGKEELYLLK